MEAINNKIFIVLLLMFNVQVCLSLDEPTETEAPTSSLPLALTEEPEKTETPTSSLSLTDESTPPANIARKLLMETPTSSPSLTDESTPAANIARNLLMDQAEPKSPATNYICTVLRNKPETNDGAGTEKLIEMLINGTHLLSKQYFPAKATILIGKMGNEKTCLAKILVSDINDLHIVKTYSKQYIVHGASNLRGVHSLVPKIYQERESDRDNTESFVDCPFYIEKARRTKSNQIAVKYFTREFLKKMSSVKTLFMVRHASLLNLKNFDDFDILASHAVNIFHNYPSYNNSIGIIVTRIEKAEQKDEVIKTGIINFFQAYEKNLTTVLSHSDGAVKKVVLKKIGFVEVLLSMDREHRILLFRTPPVCGPVNESLPILEFRTKVFETVQDSLAYADVSVDTQWVKQFSELERLFVKNSVIHLTRNVTHEMNSIMSGFMEDYSKRKFEFPTYDMQDIQEDMKKLETYLTGVLRFRHQNIWDMVDFLFQVLKKLNYYVSAVTKHKAKVLQTFFEFEDEVNSPGVMKIVEYWTSSVYNLKSLLVKYIETGTSVCDAHNVLLGLKEERRNITNQTEQIIQEREQNQSSGRAEELRGRQTMQSKYSFIRKGLKELVPIVKERKCKTLKPENGTNPRVIALGLLLSCKDQSEDGVKAFLQLGANPNITKDDSTNTSAMQLACNGENRTKAITIAKLLIQYGVNVERGFENNNTFLQQLLNKQYTDGHMTPEEFHDIVEFLGKNNSIHMLGVGNTDTFYDAIQKIEIKHETLDVMHKYRFRFDYPQVGKGFDYVKLAFERDYGYEFLKRLLDYANTFKGDLPNNENLYHLAAKRLNHEAIYALNKISTNLNVDQVNKDDGFTPLQLALVSFIRKTASGNIVEVVRSLVLNASADITYRIKNDGDGEYKNLTANDIAKKIANIPEEVVNLTTIVDKYRTQRFINETTLLIDKRETVLGSIIKFIKDFEDNETETRTRLFPKYDNNMTNFVTTPYNWLSVVTVKVEVDQKSAFKFEDSEISVLYLLLSQVLTALQQFEKKLDKTGGNAITTNQTTTNQTTTNQTTTDRTTTDQTTTDQTTTDQTAPGKTKTDQGQGGAEKTVTPISEWLNEFDKLNFSQFTPNGSKYNVDDLGKVLNQIQELLNTTQATLNDTTKYDKTAPKNFSDQILKVFTSVGKALVNVTLKPERDSLVSKILVELKPFKNESSTTKAAGNKSPASDTESQLNEIVSIVNEFSNYLDGILKKIDDDNLKQLINKCSRELEGIKESLKSMFSYIEIQGVILQ